MNARDYCDSMEIELVGWKARIYDAIRRTGRLPADHKQKVDPVIQELHHIVDDLDSRIHLLEKECPSDWASHRAEIESRMSQMKDRWKEAWGIMGEPEYGIGGA